MIRRRYSKRDANHVAIVRALRAAGRQVIELHALGGNVPDIAVCWPGGVVMMEIKVEKGRLSPGQTAFRATWRGPRGSLVVVRNATEALAAAGVRQRPVSATLA